MLLKSGCNINLCKLTHDIYTQMNNRFSFLNDPLWIYTNTNSFLIKLISKYGLKCDKDILELFVYLYKMLSEYPPLTPNQEINTNNISTFIYYIKNNLG